MSAFEIFYEEIDKMLEKIKNGNWGLKINQLVDIKNLEYNLSNDDIYICKIVAHMFRGDGEEEKCLISGEEIINL